MKKLNKNFKSDEEISKRVTLTPKKEDMSPRYIFPEDYQILKRLAYEMDKTFVELLNDVLKHSQSKKFSADLYIKYEKRKSASKTHKSVRVPNDLNNFVMEHSEISYIPAKQLLSAMIQDFAKSVE